MKRRDFGGSMILESGLSNQTRAKLPSVRFRFFCIRVRPAVRARNTRAGRSRCPRILLRRSVHHMGRAWRSRSTVPWPAHVFVSQAWIFPRLKARCVRDADWPACLALRTGCGSRRRCCASCSLCGRFRRRNTGRSRSAGSIARSLLRRRAGCRVRLAGR